MLVDQLIQVWGSLLVLIPFVLAQSGRLSTKTRLFSAFNLLGSGLLAINAAMGSQWGFLLLELVWAATSAETLFRPPLS